LERMESWDPRTLLKTPELKKRVVWMLKTAIEQNKGGCSGVRREETARTTKPPETGPRPLDRVDRAERSFTTPAPNPLRVADLTCAWTRNGLCHVAFVVDAYARKIVRWSSGGAEKTSRSWCTIRTVSVQYLALVYSRRLGEVEGAASVGSMGGSFNNALAEVADGLYGTGVIRRQRRWAGANEVELATVRWVEWWNEQGYPAGGVRNGVLPSTCRGQRGRVTHGTRFSVEPRVDQASFAGADHTNSERTNL